MRRAFADKRYAGILWSALFNAAFIALSLAEARLLAGVPCFPQYTGSNGVSFHI